MDTTQDFEPVHAGQQMLALMDAAAQWWAWMPWAAWLPPASQGVTATPEPQAAPAASVELAPVADPVPVVAVAVDDDLTRIEGIGPRIATLLKEAGITGFAALAAAHAEQLAAVLAAAGPRFRLAQPASWPQQAALLAAGDEAGFAALAAELKGGQRR
jgi:predicted flap endonuclease-1-like 5' DNA nuclease